MADQTNVREIIRAKCAQCACGNLRKAGRAVTRIYEEALRPSGLRITQFNILTATMALEPVTQTRLADETVTDRTTLARNLKTLEQKGFIHVEEGADRREREITITKKGRDRVAAAYPFWKQAQAQIVEQLGQERWKSISEGLAAMVALAKEG